MGHELLELPWIIFCICIGTVGILLLTCVFTAIVVSPILLYEFIIEKLGK